MAPVAAAAASVVMGDAMVETAPRPPRPPIATAVAGMDATIATALAPTPTVAAVVGGAGAVGVSMEAAIAVEEEEAASITPEAVANQVEVRQVVGEGLTSLANLATWAAARETLLRPPPGHSPSWPSSSPLPSQ